jgi:hypothetical protein
MNKITKKTIKRIKAGYHDDLMEAIEFLIDSYDEDKFDAGYRSCLEDLSVRSYKLATVIKKWLCVPSTDTTGVEDLAKIIEDYYTEALKQE